MYIACMFGLHRTLTFPLAIQFYLLPDVDVYIELMHVCSFIHVLS